MAELDDRIRAAFERRLQRSPEAQDLRRRIMMAVGRSDLPRPLTSRELQVLELVASGSTNAQIAERLRLSRRTVDAHVRSILTKIGVSHRSAATRWAAEHYLIPYRDQGPVGRLTPGG